MTDHRLIVTGSRNWADARCIQGALQAVADQVGPENLVTVPADMSFVDTAHMWVQAGFLKSRYRLTITMNPEEGQ